ncbi:RNA-directed DNA polymerase, eukaryota, reverse transcriptase zinc-binding domain protein [Tanacetum coccineum]
MESMNLLCVKMCWGNLAFEYAKSDSVGNSGGILCVWDPNSFSKQNVTVSDYFVMEISKWNDDVVIMGDFNEVRYKSDRFGSTFNAHGASLFNSFISSSGLMEVSLGGSAYTWCHKSASKMSKLDRFLVSESLMNNCPNISAITLERYLSDHRPILLRELNVDYGPTPFRFFHHWIEMEGFCKVVEDGWKESPCDSLNAMRNLLGKLKHLKKAIRVWNKSKSLCDSKALFISALKDVDSRIDNGHATEEDAKSRVDLISKICDIDKLKSIEMAQKIKVKWAVEGDENSSFFHGILNKKRNTQNIRGVMVNGVWLENPDKVKSEFQEHFSKRFCMPDPRDVTLQMTFPNTLSLEQQSDMECDVTNVEIKNAVWDCGTDKAPGPDGFSLGFYRHFWYLIEKDVCDVGYTSIYSCGEDGFRLVLSHLKGLLSLTVHLRRNFILGQDCLFNSLHLGGSVNYSICSSQRCSLCGTNGSNVLIWLPKHLGCLVLKAPFIYLGSMVGGTMSKANAWSDVVDRVRNRLSKWKMKTLSIGVPSGVLNSLEKLRSQFFNGHDSSSRKASWVKWKLVLAPKERGGLGVSSLYALNRGLLFKWLWRFYSQDSSLWTRVIKAIHGVDGKADVIKRTGNTSCWLNIIHEVIALKNRGIDLKKYMHIKLGNGANTDFWEDNWSKKGRNVLGLESFRSEFSVDTLGIVRKMIVDTWLPGSTFLEGVFVLTPSGVFCVTRVLRLPIIFFSPVA